MLEVCRGIRAHPCFSIDGAESQALTARLQEKCHVRSACIAKVLALMSRETKSGTPGIELQTLWLRKPPPLCLATGGKTRLRSNRLDPKVIRDFRSQPRHDAGTLLTKTKTARCFFAGRSMSSLQIGNEHHGHAKRQPSLMSLRLSIHRSLTSCPPSLAEHASLLSK